MDFPIFRAMSTMALALLGPILSSQVDSACSEGHKTGRIVTQTDG